MGRGRGAGIETGGEARAAARDGAEELRGRASRATLVKADALRARAAALGRAARFRKRAAAAPARAPRFGVEPGMVGDAVARAVPRGTPAGRRPFPFAQRCSAALCPRPKAPPSRTAGARASPSQPGVGGRRRRGLSLGVPLL